MITVGPLKTNPRQVAEARKLLQSEGIDAVLQWLRSTGANKIDSIKVVMVIEDVPLGKAKEIVHMNRAWDDTRANDDALHDTLADFVDQLNREQEGFELLKAG